MQGRLCRCPGAPRNLQTAPELCCMGSIQCYYCPHAADWTLTDFQYLPQSLLITAAEQQSDNKIMEPVMLGASMCVQMGEMRRTQGSGSYPGGCVPHWKQPGSLTFTLRHMLETRAACALEQRLSPHPVSYYITARNKASPHMSP